MKINIYTIYNYVGIFRENSYSGSITNESLTNGIPLRNSRQRDRHHTFVFSRIVVVSCSPNLVTRRLLRSFHSLFIKFSSKLCIVSAKTTIPIYFPDANTQRLLVNNVHFSCVTQLPTRKTGRANR